ncbi:hypothetical protein PZH44_16165, partial [Alistipes putredinis]
KITEYHEGEFIRLLGSGVNRDDVDEEGKLLEVYEKEHLYYSFLDESSYREITGQDLSVENGTYYMIRNSSMYENQYNRYDDLDYVQNTYADIDKDMK